MFLLRELMFLHRKHVFLHWELMYYDWKHKLSRCKITFFSRFHKIIIIVFCSIYHRIVPFVTIGSQVATLAYLCFVKPTRPMPSFMAIESWQRTILPVAPLCSTLPGSSTRPAQSIVVVVLARSRRQECSAIRHITTQIYPRNLAISTTIRTFAVAKPRE